MTNAALTKPSLVGGFFSTILGMPKWYKLVLTLATVLLGAGGVGQIATAVKGSEAPTAVTTQTNAPGSSSSVVPGASTGGTSTAVREPTLVEKYSPAALRIGISVLAAFIIGWLFRSFLKFMALLTLVVGGGFALLTYFKVVNVDLSSAQGHYQSAMDWLTDQAGRLKELVVQYLPSNVGKVLGFYLGFRRHRS